MKIVKKRERKRQYNLSRLTEFQFPFFIHSKSKTRRDINSDWSWKISPRKSKKRKNIYLDEFVGSELKNGPFYLKILILYSNKTDILTV